MLQTKTHTQVAGDLMDPQPGGVIFFPTLVPGSYGQRPFSTNKFAGL